MIVAPGQINVITYFVMRLQASGQRATGLTPGDFDLQFTRSGSAAAAKVDATLNGNGVGGAHSDNTVIEVDATDSPGLYRIDWPDAAFASGVDEVDLNVNVATAFSETLRVELAPPVNIVQINGDATDGNNATLKLKQLDVTNTAGEAVRILTSAGFADAVHILSTSDGIGLHVEGDTAAQFEGTTNDILADTTGNVSGSVGSVTGGATDVKQDRNADLIESLRPSHTGQGDVYYVAPTNGNDSTGDGSRALPYKTLQAAITDLVVSSHHDVIILLADNAAGVTVHNSSSAIECNKRYFSIRGPGRDVIVTNDTNNVNTFEITADGVSISGVQIGTHTAGTGEGITITAADFHEINDCWFLDTRGDGVHITRGENTQIHDNHFLGTGVAANGQGVHVAGTGGSSSNNRIFNNEFADTGGTAIFIEQGTIANTIINNNIIHGATGWGIDIGAASTDAIVFNNTLGNNSSGDINDDGTTSIILNNYDVVDGVWDEPLTGSSHNDATSAGRRLRQVASNILGPFTVASATANTISLDADASLSEVDGSYDPARIFVDSGTGADQTGQIVEYFGSAGNGNLARTIILREDLKVTLNATSEIFIIVSDGRNSTNQGQLREGSTTTATLNALAPGSDVSGQILHFTAGTGQDQVALIESYSDPVATFQAIDVAVDATTSYELLPAGCVNVAMIDKQPLPAQRLALSAGTIVSGAAEAGTLSTTQMTTDLAEATNDHYAGRVIIWTSGVLKDQATAITAYLGATGMLTYTAVTEAPTAADTFIIV